MAKNAQLSHSFRRESPHASHTGSPQLTQQGEGERGHWQAKQAGASDVTDITALVTSPRAFFLREPLVSNDVTIQHIT
jgi:hypothetical protein